MRQCSVVQICSIEGCERPLFAREWCNGHYQRWYRKLPKSEPIQICSIEGCDHPAKTRGWCNMHYIRWTNHGTPLWEPPEIKGDPRDLWRHRAQKTVRQAIRDGILVKPAQCSQCPETYPIEAHHHHGYARECWLDVVWLCPKCHGATRRGTTYRKRQR
jgi:hypothetical protein